MQREFSKVSSIVPEIHWDIITRIFPGLILIIGFILLSFKYEILKYREDWITLITSLTVLLLSFIIAYILGLLIDSIGQIFDSIFMLYYDPTKDLISKKYKLTGFKKFIRIIEIILGAPFSFFKLYEYKSTKFSPKKIDELNRYIEEEIGQVQGFSKVIQIFYFLKVKNEALHGPLLKFRAEAIMIRNVSIVILLFFIYSITRGDILMIIVEWFLFALCISVYSVKRKTSILRVYETFISVKKNYIKAIKE